MIRSSSGRGTPLGPCYLLEHSPADLKMEGISIHEYLYSRSPHDELKSQDRRRDRGTTTKISARIGIRYHVNSYTEPRARFSSKGFADTVKSSTRVLECLEKRWSHADLVPCNCWRNKSNLSTRPHSGSSSSSLQLQTRKTAAADRL